MYQSGPKMPQINRGEKLWKFATVVIYFATFEKTSVDWHLVSLKWVKETSVLQTSFKEGVSIITYPGDGRWGIKIGNFLYNYKWGNIARMYYTMCYKFY